MGLGPLNELLLTWKNSSGLQVIDGPALLLMTRNDVLRGLNIRLGPALKLYRLVRVLQTRLPNLPLPL